MTDHISEKKSRSATERYIAYVIVLLLIALGFLVFFLVRDYRALRRERIINAREFWLNAVVHNHGHLGASNITDVRSWMTFDYVNQLFGLPLDYLKGQLAITDPRYPRLSLSGYAKSKQVSSATLIGEVENALRAYFAASTPATPSSTSI